jgi:hypothetical protein
MAERGFEKYWATVQYDYDYWYSRIFSSVVFGSW